MKLDLFLLLYQIFKVKKKTIFFKDLGVKEYKVTWIYQKKLHNTIINNKNNNNIIGYLLFVEYYNHIYTIGQNCKRYKHLLVSEYFLDQINAYLYKIDRGGDITYHGPGQLVVYPILDMNYFFLDIHKYIRYLEEVVIYFLYKYYKINGIRIKGKTGVWIINNKQLRKICSIGIKIKRWTTMHGLSLNVNPNLKYFDYIIPCGISDCKMTSMKKELYINISFKEVKYLLKQSFENIFNIECISN